MGLRKEANIAMDEARALVADQALWPRLRDFLWDFAPQIHESWLEGLWGGTAADGDGENPSASLLLSLRSSSRVKRFILSSLGVEPCFHFFPKDDWSRLLLLDQATLESVAMWLGALACADGLRRVTDGATVRGLKAALTGVYPDVFGFTMYFRGLDALRGDAEAHGDDGQADGGRKSPAEDVVSTGLSMLYSLVDSLPAPLLSRLRLKLPKGHCAAASPGGVSPQDAESRRDGVQTAVARLLKLKFPEAYSLCC